MNIYQQTLYEIKQRKQARYEKRVFWCAYKRYREHARLNYERYGVKSTLKSVKLSKEELKNLLNCYHKASVYKTRFQIAKGNLTDLILDRFKRIKYSKTRLYNFSHFELCGIVYDNNHKELRDMLAKILQEERREHQKQKSIMRMIETYGITKTEAERCYLGKVDLEKIGGTITFGIIGNHKYIFPKSEWWRDHTIFDRKKMRCDMCGWAYQLADEFNIYPEELKRICGALEIITEPEIRKNWETIKNESWWKLERELMCITNHGDFLFVMLHKRPIQTQFDINDGVWL